MIYSFCWVTVAYIHTRLCVCGFWYYIQIYWDFQEFWYVVGTRQNLNRLFSCFIYLWLIFLLLAGHPMFLKVLLECLVVGRIFSQIPILRGPILALVYEWYINVVLVCHRYTNTKCNRKKEDKINSFANTRTIKLLNTWYTYK